VNDLHHKNQDLLKCITRAHVEYPDLTDHSEIFKGFLNDLLQLTDSEYGFIGEILHTEEQQPYTRMFAVSDISWDAASKKLYQEAIENGMEFRNHNTLFGHVMTSQDVVISNNPETDDRSGGLPHGHPPLNAFLGLPIKTGSTMVGMVGISNRPGGFEESHAKFLEPFLMTLGFFIQVIRDEDLTNQISRALNSAQDRSQSVLDSTLDSIITIDGKGIIETANKTTEKMFGYSLDMLIGGNISVLMPEPQRSQHDTYLSDYLETGEAKVVGIGREVVGRRKDGSRFPVDLAVTELFLPGKHLFTGILRDISASKLAKKQAKESRIALEQSNENMLAILNESQQGIVMMDADGVIQYVSTTCENLLGTEAAKLIGQEWEKACPFNGVQKSRLKAMIESHPRSRTKFSEALSTENGKDFWMEIDVRDDPRDHQSKILFLRDITEIQSLRAEINSVTTRLMVASSPAMQEMFKLFDKLALGDWTVLIEGETGAGKELTARGLHANSARKHQPFVTFNCGGLTESLFTSQLFGHRRGAFTSAITDQEGVFEAANGGTIFLDEIGEIPITAQSALLRAIEEREIVRIGETKPRPIDVRILSATNRDLYAETEAGRFRTDLLYRISVARLRVPPLRERLEDIPLLTNLFIAESGASKHKRISGISMDALRCLKEYHWPGNVRELRNVVEMASIHCSSEIIEVQDLATEVQNSVPSKSPLGASSSFVSRHEDPRDELLEALRVSRGHRSQAAELLGISRATFYRRLNELGIDNKAIREHLNVTKGS